MYRYVEFHINSILLDITLPPGPEATPTTILVKVSKRTTLAQLKEELVPLIGVPPTGFRVYRIIGNEEYEMKKLDETFKDGSKLIVRLGRELRRGEKRIKLYLLQVNNTEFCKYMMESIVAEDIPVRELKKQIIEEVKVLGIDFVLELDKMRLREKNGVSPGRVYLDHERIGDDWIFATNKEIHVYVEPLKACTVKPFDPKVKLSELSGVPAEYIYYSQELSFPVDISCLDIENKLRWYSITSDRYLLGLYDGYVLYYKY
ncbi:PREDICTED: ubiquitin carboxyl-terminal hydrolase 47-like [Amphimedon queenslandica]|uniref:Ubiquitin carboxyl-terminal hydrolase 47 C-terminal domain-containing protein n=1 Tax=Amphimedon queenslandica TaxID=400682 RepID=A0AAN0IP95_AMPQE|nr:PREDICTED: ubiquitin carboxyl-terminal hydrolase 47-like [Amphimedon queenslandica]|eukprot:XP_011405885.1 PREDICTED: ubiquitin carboxyl-terminal hydrolase 47-like [Amphimedon queenslandica]